MTFKESLLWPLSVIYGGVAAVRARAYGKGIFRQRRLNGVVISVGNLTVGGTGKTPMVLWIAERLFSEGKRVGILTRGYRGKTAAPESKTAGEPGIISTSDEVQLLKSRLGDRALFGIGADRYKNGLALSGRGVEWFILDDGFQHLKLARNVDVVLIDTSMPFGGGHLLPAGRLREPRGALKRADVVVITRSNHAPAIESVVRHYSSAPIFYARTELDSVRSRLGPQQTSAELRGKALFAFCGIGNPGAFYSDLREWGFYIVGHKSFRDHHRFTAADMAEIENEARKAGALGLICTEKDGFNLPGAVASMNLWVCAISLLVDREEEFWRTVLEKAQSGASEGRQD
ncbi:MAG: tetraacyldisaccharide 4'-kinase [Candidatus Acidiferrales bacterium]